MIKNKVQFLKDNEITKDKVGEFLNDLFYIVRQEGRFHHSDIFDDALDASVGGHTGVMLLSAYLNGSAYDLETKENGKREYEKKKPVDCKIIYQQALELIDYLDSLIKDDTIKP